MKYSMVFCLLAVVLLQQCMSAHVHHEGEKNDEDHKTHMSHEGGDHKGHKHENCGHPSHLVEDHTSHTVEDHTGHNHGPIENPIYDDPIHDNGAGGVYGHHQDIILQKFRKGQALYYQ
ncbi:unnamed protein product [Macrosiphum euphorbiae]|uniref:Uncharacterized protein n=1 Tax=Macrosiphum euphorbiae TaxID=13131 RepID=A0AAV0WV92_9HEMI|nr:unnamed protein product [Macrosiphum euphorbiae]